MRTIASLSVSFCLLVGLPLVGLGCDEDTPSVAIETTPPTHETTPASAADPERVAPTPAPPSTAPAGPVATGEMYEVRADVAGPFTSGQPGQISLVLTGRGGWHVNQDYPTSVDLTGTDSVSFAKPRLEKADATEFVTERARFNATLTPTAAGEHRVEAQVNFVMCTATSCSAPQHATVAVTLPVAGS